jgi:secreted protein with Ig-like and vWFA domain
MRQHSKKTIVLLTDGQSNYGSNPVTVARKLSRDYGNKLAIIALGIGDQINYQELKNITKHHEDNLLVIFGSYKAFTSVVDKIIDLLSHGQDQCDADFLDKKKRK